MNNAENESLAIIEEYMPWDCTCHGNQKVKLKWGPCPKNMVGYIQWPPASVRCDGCGGILDKINQDPEYLEDE